MSFIITKTHKINILQKKGYLWSYQQMSWCSFHFPPLSVLSSILPLFQGIASWKEVFKHLCNFTGVERGFWFIISETGITEKKKNIKSLAIFSCLFCVFILKNGKLWASKVIKGWIVPVLNHATLQFLAQLHIIYMHSQICCLILSFCNTYLMCTDSRELNSCTQSTLIDILIFLPSQWDFSHRNGWSV